jgi:putative addiction module antidote
LGACEADGRPHRVLGVAQTRYLADMRRAITLRRVGGSVGTILPREMVDRLGLTPGDRILAVETEDGILLTPITTAIDEELAATRRAAKRHRGALRELSG